MPWLTIHAMSWSSMFPASHLRVLWLWRIGNPITMLHIHCVIPRILNTLRGMLGYFFRRSWRRDVIFVYSCSILLTLGLCRPMSWLADSCSLVHTNKSPHVMLGWFVFYGMHEHFLGLLLALCLAVTQSWILGLSSTLWAHQHSLGISLIGSSSLVVFHTCVGYFFSLFFLFVAYRLGKSFVLAWWSVMVFSWWHASVCVSPCMAPIHIDAYVDGFMNGFVVIGL